MTSRRQERIAEVLTEELGLLIASELTDPRLDDAMVTVTDVQVSPDLGNARRVHPARVARPRNRATC